MSRLNLIKSIEITYLGLVKLTFTTWPRDNFWIFIGVSYVSKSNNTSLWCALKQLEESLYNNSQQMGNMSLTDFFHLFWRELVGNQEPGEGPSGKRQVSNGQKDHWGGELRHYFSSAFTMKKTEKIRFSGDWAVMVTGFSTAYEKLN